MYVCNDFSKMVIQYNSRGEIEMSSTSDIRLVTSNMVVIENCVTGKKRLTIFI